MMEKPLTKMMRHVLTNSAYMTQMLTVPFEQDDDESTTSEESADEAIIVTRQEEEIDPEDDADFEREYAKMMAESLESRKLDRRPVFDVALPVRSRPRENSSLADQGDSGVEAAPAPKMAFSLLTKKGNKQQASKIIIVRTTTANKLTDSDAGTSCRFPLCGCYEKPATGGTRRTTAHQEPRIELRSS